MLSKKWIMGKGFATFCTLLNSAEMPCHMLYIYILAIWCEKLTHWKRPWCWERLKVGGEGHNRGWDGWMASRTRWTWVWVSSGSWWWTGKPGVLWSMGSQRVRQDWATELNWTELREHREKMAIKAESRGSALKKRSINTPYQRSRTWPVFFDYRKYPCVLLKHFFVLLD